jgi:hypothetical protein
VYFLVLEMFLWADAALTAQHSGMTGGARIPPQPAANQGPYNGSWPQDCWVASAYGSSPGRRHLHSSSRLRDHHGHLRRCTVKPGIMLIQSVPCGDRPGAGLAS